MESQQKKRRNFILLAHALSFKRRLRTASRCSHTFFPIFFFASRVALMHGNIFFIRESILLTFKVKTKLMDLSCFISLFFSFFLFLVSHAVF